MRPSCSLDSGNPSSGSWVRHVKHRWLCLTHTTHNKDHGWSNRACCGFSTATKCRAISSASPSRLKYSNRAIWPPLRSHEMTTILWSLYGLSRLLSISPCVPRRHGPSFRARSKPATRWTAGSGLFGTYLMRGRSPLAICPTLRGVSAQSCHSPSLIERRTLQAGFCGAGGGFGR